MAALLGSPIFIFYCNVKNLILERFSSNIAKKNLEKIKQTNKIVH